MQLTVIESNTCWGTRTNATVGSRTRNGSQEQYLSTLPPEAFEPDDDAPWDIFDNDDVPRVIIDDARVTVAIMPPNTDPTQQIDRISALQRLLNACAGVLAAEQLAFADTQLAQQRADKVQARNLEGRKPDCQRIGRPRRDGLRLPGDGWAVLEFDS